MTKRTRVFWIPGIITAIGLAQLALAQDLLKPKVTPACNDCLYKLSWSVPDSSYVGHYELFLSDPSQPNGRRLIYKGPGTKTIITTSGPRTAALRACIGDGNCSEFDESDLVPEQNTLESSALDKLRISAPIELIHRTESRDIAISAPRAVHELQTVLLDLSAAAQQGCGAGTEDHQRVWNIGTRMTISLSPDLQFKVVNQSIVEHHGEFWTWHGIIVDDHRGSVSLTVNECDVSMYASIISDAGDYVIRPTTAPLHAAYRVGAPVFPEPHDCSQQMTHEPTSIFSINELEPSAAAVADLGTDVHRIQFGSYYLDSVKNQLAPLAYLLGYDHDQEPDKFLDTRAMIELFPDLKLKFDFRQGKFSARSPGNWSWVGCAAGEPESRLWIHVDAEHQHLSALFEGEHRVIETLQRGENRYVVVERIPQHGPAN